MTISVSVGQILLTIHKYRVYIKLHTSSFWSQQGLFELGQLQDHLKFPLGELLHQLVKYFIAKRKKSVSQIVPSHLKLILCLTSSKTSWRTRQGSDSKAHLVYSETNPWFPVAPQLWLYDLWPYSSMGLIYHSASGVSWWSLQRCRLGQKVLERCLKSHMHLKPKKLRGRQMGGCSIVKALHEVFCLILLSEATYLLSTVLPEESYMITFFFFFKEVFLIQEIYRLQGEGGGGTCPPAPQRGRGAVKEAWISRGFSKRFVRKTHVLPAVLWGLWEPHNKIHSECKSYSKGSK